MPMSFWCATLEWLSNSFCDLCMSIAGVWTSTAWADGETVLFLDEKERDIKQRAWPSEVAYPDTHPDLSPERGTDRPITGLRQVAPSV